MSVHVPELTEDHSTSLRSSVKKWEALAEQDEQFTELFQKWYWSQQRTHAEYLGYKWVKYLKDKQSEDCGSLRCSGISHYVIDQWTHKNMTETAKWMALTTKQILPDSWKLQEGNAPDEKFARHMSRMSLIASRRTEDPNSPGVGVIITTKDEVVSVGLNAFPSKARFGDFVRDTEPNPFLLHAEENALLLRNTRDIDDNSTTAYISNIGGKTPPCETCLTLLKEAGVRILVLTDKVKCDWQPPENMKTFYFQRSDVDGARKALFGCKRLEPRLAKLQHAPAFGIISFLMHLPLFQWIYARGMSRSTPHSYCFFVTI